MSIQLFRFLDRTIQIHTYNRIPMAIRLWASIPISSHLCITINTQHPPTQHINIQVNKIPRKCTIHHPHLQLLRSKVSSSKSLGRIVLEPLHKVISMYPSICNDKLLFWVRECKGVRIGSQAIWDLEWVKAAVKWDSEEAAYIRQRRMTPDATVQKMSLNTFRDGCKPCWFAGLWNFELSYDNRRSCQ